MKNKAVTPEKTIKASIIKKVGNMKLTEANQLRPITKASTTHKVGIILPLFTHIHLPNLFMFS